MRLTQRSAKALSLPEGKADHIHFDSDLPGFGLRIRAGGSRRFIVQFDALGKTRRVVLGSPAEIDAADARERAREILAASHLGRDPIAERDAARAAALDTVGARLRDYLGVKRNQLRPRSYVNSEHNLLKLAKPLHGRPISAANLHVDIDALLRTVAATSGPGAAGKLRKQLSAFFAWAVQRKLTAANPVLATDEVTGRGPRTRVLSDADVRVIWSALPAGQYGDILKLLLLLGSRRDEIGALRWSEIDLDAELIRLPPERTKTNQPHDIPLTVRAIEILRQQPRSSEFVFGRAGSGFGAWSAGKRRLDAAIAASGATVEPWVLHDFRRLISTTMNDKLRVEPWVVEGVLGHRVGGVAGVYNRANYIAQRRAALVRWADYLLGVVGERPTVVVTFPQAG